MSERSDETSRPDAEGSQNPVKKLLGDRPVAAAGAGLAGAALGAAGGMMAGPLGIVPGAAAGAAAGVTLVQGVDTPAEDDYDVQHWRELHARQPATGPQRSYEDCESAYRYGHSAAARYPDATSWDELSDQLASGWIDSNARSPLAWGEAEPLARTAWEQARAQRTAAGH
ncbi:hypothetical protein [Caldimonas brevitalea]|uniref:Uncharacterized protein n=1 Tax=Caldimonas brevitalea TaxID=413882 RepID=A0A0G3BIJ8_9BURK|nr:hypothetical protein [Caldimonas brevitalea]AKJ27211.1 hypothetical protein AAW51_0520 [Caldimonas brevitalea]